MHDGKPCIFDEDKVRRALLETWSDRTQPAFRKERPAYNQCAQTAIVLLENFGGQILKTRIRTRDGEIVEHFYNRINGKDYDFTKEQFEIEHFVKPIIYLDIVKPG